MLPNAITSNLQRFLIILAGCVLVIACLYVAKAILLPLVMAMLFTFMLSPVVSVLQKWHLGRVLSVLVAAGVAFSFLALLVWLFTIQLSQFAHELPKHKETIVKKIAGLQGTEEGVLGSLYKMVQDVSEEIDKGTGPAHKVDEVEKTSTVIVKDTPPRMNLSWIQVLIGPLLDTLIGAVLVVVLAFLMLIDRENLRNRLIRLAGRTRLISTTRVLDDVAQRISRFLFAQAIINIGFGALLAAGLYLIGVPYAGFFGLLAGFLRFIPYLGSSIVAAVLLLCTFAFLPGWTQCLLAMGLLGALELLTAYAVEPFLLGRRTGATPIALLVAATFWTWLWGPIGLLLSTPLTVSLIVLGKYVPNLTFLSVLLGDEPVLRPSLRFYQRLLARDQDEAFDVLEGYLHEHPAATVYDGVLLPALVLAKRDAAHDELTGEQEKWMHHFLRETIDEHIAAESARGPEGPPPHSRPILACAAHDEADDLALRMLEQLLETRGQTMQSFSSKTLATEILSAVEETNPATVVIVSLPPGGLTHTHYLCKRLRHQFPKLTIVVGRWGLDDRIEETRKRAQAAGANELHVAVLETVNAIAPLPRPTFSAKNPSFELAHS